MDETKHAVVVIGHRNPDTDSICSAIAYAALKNQTSDQLYEARRAGEINEETAFVLKHFGVEPPRLCLDINPKVSDVNYRKCEAISGSTSLRHAWTIMRNQEIDTLPVVDSEGRLQGLIAVKDITTANMDVFDTEVLAKSHTSYRNILETLEGTMEVGNPDAFVEYGRVFIGAASPESMEETLHPGDIVILSNRYESQLCAIEIGVSLLIVCHGAPVSKTIRKLAKERNVAIMRVPFDTYAAAKLICQSAPVSYIMTTQNLVKFSLYTQIAEVLKVMAKVRHRYFPILDENGKYCGMLSRRNVINMPKRQMILVDHNEQTQAVEGTSDAEILEIIDHHRIGRPETSKPIFFRNQPVGCTATIITQMYMEAEVEIPGPIAGILLSAILSDTLAFRSPTSTAVGKRIAQMLASRSQVDMDSFAGAMFEAGENLEGKTAEEVLFRDFKIYTCADTRFGIAQMYFMTETNLNTAKNLVQPYLLEGSAKQRVEDLYVMLTNIPTNATVVVFAGANAEHIMEEAFGFDCEKDGIKLLQGIVSRKKQFLPAIMQAYHRL